MSNEENNVKEKMKILSPMVDVVFQMLFGERGCERITKDLLSTVLDENIENINLDENIVLRRETINDKMGIVDVLAKINENEYCNIELQLLNKKNIIKRLLYYWAKQFTKEIKSGQNFNELKRTIVILIANFKIEKLKQLEFHTKWQIKEDNVNNFILTDDLEIHIIEIPKMNKEKAKGRDIRLKEWLEFWKIQRVKRY